MDEYKSEGIILDTTPYGDSRQIASVFTREQGLVRLIGRRKTAALMPLVRAQLVYTRSRSSIMTCTECVIVDSYHAIRENFTRLDSGCRILRALLATQQQEQRASMLYDVAIRYLNRLAASPTPVTLSTSFLLKLLRHEGLLQVGDRCSTCGMSTSTAHFFGGQRFCSKHAPLDAIAFNSEEIELLIILTGSRRFEDIENLGEVKPLCSRIERLFEAGIYV